MRNVSESALGLEEVLWVKEELGIAARGKIPGEAEFFKDHFPGFPILPGVLALEMLKQTSDHYFRITQGSEKLRCEIKKITAVKFSHYLKPGDAWESQLKYEGREGGLTKWTARLLHNGENAVSAKLTVELQKIQPVII